MNKTQPDRILLRVKRLARWGAAALLLVAITLLIAEALLQVGSRFIRDRSEVAQATGRLRIIGIGDSHMYGAMVADDETFPAELQAALDRRRPSEFSVINLGVPGMNTSQIRNRFADNLAVYQPDVILIWCGVNNLWNRSEADEEKPLPVLEAYAQRSRLYRMYRVWVHNNEIDEAVSKPLIEDRQTVTKLAGKGMWTLEHRGKEETLISTDFDQKRTHDQIQARAYSDFLEMARWADAAGVPVAFIGYPVEWSHFAPANFAMQAAANETGAVYIPTKDTYRHLPKADQKMLNGGHPTAAMYRMFANESVPTVLKLVD